MHQTSCDQEDLARKILLHSRRRISQIAPLLLEAIYSLPEMLSPHPGPLSTNGCVLWFTPEQVVDDFRGDRDAVARQLLHITAHCLLGHLELRSEFDQPQLFDLSADWKAAQLAEGFCGPAFAVKHGDAAFRSSYETTQHLPALYRELLEGRTSRKRLKQQAAAACFDDHTLWTANPARSPGAGADGQGHGETGPSSDSQPAEISMRVTPDWGRIRQSMLEGSHGTLPGCCAGLLRETVSVKERGLSFSQFLRRFAAPEERMLLDPDTIDIRWYHLGLEHYGDIPLLEPSELSESPLPDDLVVALDVSGSCQGDLSRRFLKELLGILRDISAGAPRFRVLLLLCDTEIQKEVLLETPDQIETLFSSFTVTGFGGTDFRPVFDRVAQLRAEGILPRVRGLLYLSDGWGAFPDTPTDYPTAFLLPASGRSLWPSETSWITRLTLNDTDFTLQEADI